MIVISKKAFDPLEVGELPIPPVLEDQIRSRFLLTPTTS
jgi:hypothetical protein